MKIPEEQFELIVKYVDADLQEAERESFNELMLSSEPFRKELLEVEMIIASIKAIAHKQNVQRVKNIIRKLDEDKKTKRHKKLRTPARLGIAASITLLALFTYLGINRSNPVDKSSIFQTYYEPYPSGRNFRNNAKVSKGLEYYGNRQYEKAIPILETEMKDPGASELIELYIANSYLMTGRFAEAEKVLKSAGVTEAGTLTNQYMLWYLGLTLIQLEKEEEAKEQFRKLSQKGGIYEQEAKAILEVLE